MIWKDLDLLNHCIKQWFCKYRQDTHWKSRHNAVHLSRTHSLINSCTEFFPVFVRKTFEFLPLAPIPLSWFLWSKLVFPVLSQYLCWVKILKAASSHETLTNSVYSDRKRKKKERKPYFPFLFENTTDLVRGCINKMLMLQEDFRSSASHEIQKCISVLHQNIGFWFPTKQGLFFFSRNHKNRYISPQKKALNILVQNLIFPFQAEIKPLYDHTIVHGLSSTLEGLDNH